MASDDHLSAWEERDKGLRECLSDGTSGGWLFDVAQCTGAVSWQLGYVKRDLVFQSWSNLVVSRVPELNIVNIRVAIYMRTEDNHGRARGLALDRDHGYS